MWFHWGFVTKLLLPFLYIFFVYSCIGPPTLFFAPFGLILIWLPEKFDTLLARRLWLYPSKRDPIAGAVPHKCFIIALGWLVLSFPLIFVYGSAIIMYVNRNFK